jgi:hypothetical protein
MATKDVWIRILRRAVDIRKKTPLQVNDQIRKSTASLNIKPIKADATGTTPVKTSSTTKKHVANITVGKTYATATPLKVNVNILGYRPGVPSFGVGHSTLESFYMIENVYFQWSYGRSLNESINFEEQLAFGIGKTIQEFVVFNDVLNTDSAIGYDRIGANAFALSELLNKTVGKAHQEGVNFQETVAKAYGKNVQETFTLNDVLNAGLGRASSNSESFGFSEIIVRDTGKGISESFRFEETMAYLLAKTIQEFVGFAENVTVQKSGEGALDEASGVRFSELLLKNFERLSTESFSVSESVSLNSNKNISETLSFSEVLVKDISKSIQESFTLAENVNTEKAGDGTLDRSDSMQFIELISKSISMTLQESFGLSELLLKEVGKLNQESFSLSELISRDMDKTLQESFGMNELLSKDVGKTTQETFSLSELMSKDVGKGVQESFGFNETSSMSVSKNIQEFVAFSENMERYIPPLGGDDYSGLIEEGMAISEQGLLHMQNYAEAFYFAEDYVGSTQTF